MLGRYILELGVENTSIGFLESWHKDKRSMTVCNNRNFARYFTTEKACKTMIETINLAYPQIGVKIHAF